MKTSLLVSIGFTFLWTPTFGEDLKIRGTPPYTPFTNCVADYLRPEPRVFRVLVGNIPSSMIGGETGDGLGSNPDLFVEDRATLYLDLNGNPEDVFNNNMPLRKGELVVVKGTNDFLFNDEHLNEVQNTTDGRPINLLHIHLRSLLKHSITRGRGAFQHQTEETLNTHLSLHLKMSCETFKSVWEKMFERVGYKDVERVLNSYPSGVLVDEVKEGMTPAAVVAVFGAPERKASIGGKSIYFYPKMKVTFTNGKVSNIE